MPQSSFRYLYEPVKQIRTFLNREPGQLLVAGGWEGAKGGVRQKVHSRHLFVDRACFFYEIQTQVLDTAQRERIFSKSC